MTMLKRKDLTPDVVVNIFGKHFKHHYVLNDAAHREQHFQEVQGTALQLNRKLGLGVDEVLIAIVAWTHDLFAWDRTNHHTLAAHWVRVTDFWVIQLLDDEERELVAQACAEHRASYKGEFTSMLSEVISSADRGFASVREILQRAYDYRQGEDESPEVSLKESVEHLVEKFGRGGYARLPDLYRLFYAIELEQRYNDIERLAQLEPSIAMAYLKGDVELS